MTLTTESPPRSMRVSIIIPTYRERGFIDETVASAARNIRDDDEIIVVPNGSSADYVLRLRRDLPARCRFVELSAGGVALARNAGCAQATGDAVLFLDDDDLLIDGGLERLRTMLAEHPEWGAMTGEVIRFGANGEMGGERYPHPSQRITDLRLLGQCLTSPGAVLMRRQLFVAVDGFRQERTPAEDLDFWLRVSLINPVVGVPVPLLRYRIHDGAVSSASAAMAQRHMQIFRDHSRSHLQWAFPASLRLASLKVFRWYAPRLRAERLGARRQGKWRLLLDTVHTEWCLLLLVLGIALRVKLMLLLQARWGLRPGELEAEDAQRGQMISRMAEAP
jgi:glycosyltransferase involved in cell wall biosynthesis